MIYKTNNFTIKEFGLLKKEIIDLVERNPRLLIKDFSVEAPLFIKNIQ
jgi:hypothetical protein